MDIIEAIGTRISIRAFEERAIAQDALDELAAELARVNEESGFNFQLYGPREDGTALDLSPRMFANNPPAYLALVGPAGEIPEEQLGYYGEKLVLKATQLGLELLGRRDLRPLHHPRGAGGRREAARRDPVGIRSPDHPHHAAHHPRRHSRTQQEG